MERLKARNPVKGIGIGYWSGQKNLALTNVMLGDRGILGVPESVERAVQVLANALMIYAGHEPIYDLPDYVFDKPAILNTKL